MKLGSLGNKRLISSILWTQTLLEADIDHYKGKAYDNWLYLRFRTISELDPKFYENYIWGGMYLAIIKDDVLGGIDVLERGLKYYPDDFKLNYNAGFNYYFELGDFKKGLEKLEKIVNHKDSYPGLPFIVNKLRFETSGNYDATLSFLYQRYSMTNDPVLKEKLYSDMYAIKAQRDLECLNENKNDCVRTDLDKKFYVKKNGKWQTLKKFTPYKIYLKK